MGELPRTPATQPYRLLRGLGRALVIASAWATALALGVAGFAAGSRPGSYEAVGFGIAFGVASLVAAVAALAVGGRPRLAIEAAAAVVGSLLLASWAAAMMLWLLPTTTQSLARLGSQDLLRLRWLLVAIAGDVLTRSRSLVMPAVGAVAGTAAGLLMRLSRRRPTLAAGLAVGLLVGLGASASLAGRVVADLVLESRLQGGVWAVSSFSADELANALGAVSGSVVGAIGACAMLRRPRGRPESVSAEEPSS
jgi:hypothetical protein